MVIVTIIVDVLQELHKVVITMWLHNIQQRLSDENIYIVDMTSLKKIHHFYHLNNKDFIIYQFLLNTICSNSVEFEACEIMRRYASVHRCM